MDLVRSTIGPIAFALAFSAAYCAGHKLVKAEVENGATASPAPGDTVSRTGKCAPDEKVKWLTENEAVTLGKESGKPIVIVFYNDHCRKCEVLEDKGFNRPETACYVNGRLAASRINGEKEAELKKKYRVNYYPTVWFLTPEAKEIDSFSGYVDPDKLFLILQFVGEKAYETKTFAEYEKEKKGPSP